MDNKRYEILDALPPYGDMYIPIAKNNEPYYSQGFAVKLYRTDGTQWVGNFKPGWTDFNKVIELKNTPNLLIIAGGACYILDLDKNVPIDIFGVGYTNALDASNGRIVLIDQSDLTIIESNGIHWDSERISWDGLKEVTIVDDIIRGLSYDPMPDSDEWIDFEYDINNKILVGGSYNRYNIVKKPKWKFW